MRSGLTLAAGLCLALAVPVAALAGAPTATGRADTAVAYFEGSGECVIMTLNQGTYRPIGSDLPSYGQSLDVQLADDCASYDQRGVELGATSYQIFGLTAAYVVVPSVVINGHEISVDVSWVAVGTPTASVETVKDHPEWSFVGKDVAAHLTGTVLVDGVPLTGNQDNAILRTFAVVKNY